MPTGHPIIQQQYGTVFHGVNKQAVPPDGKQHNRGQDGAGWRPSFDPRPGQNYIDRQSEHGQAGHPEDIFGGIQKAYQAPSRMPALADDPDRLKAEVPFYGRSAAGPSALRDARW